FREHGVISPTMAEVLRIRAHRAQQPPAEQNNARQYWEQRKQFLGLRRDMGREEQVERIAALRHGTTLPTVQRSHSRTQVQPRKRGASLASQAQRLAQALGQEETQGYGAGLRVRLD